MSIELVSFILCPFVQRSVIALNEKSVPHTLTYIDIENPPDWFKEISPFGKVPLLRVEGQVLFESAIINEYLDEVYPPSLHPASALERARHRGWIEFGSNLLFDQHKVIMAKDEDEYIQAREALGGSLARLVREVSEGPYFGGAAFSLVDAAYAPFFMRFNLLQGQREDLAEAMPSALESWAEALAVRPSVIHSVAENFEQRYLDFFRAKGSHILAAG